MVQDRAILTVADQ